MDSCVGLEAGGDPSARAEARSDPSEWRTPDNVLTPRLGGEEPADGVAVAVIEADDSQRQDGFVGRTRDWTPGPRIVTEESWQFLPTVAQNPRRWDGQGRVALGR